MSVFAFFARISRDLPRYHTKMSSMEAKFKALDVKCLGRLDPEDIAAGYSKDEFPIPIDAAKLIVRAITGNDFIQPERFYELDFNLQNFINAFQFN